MWIFVIPFAILLIIASLISCLIAWRGNVSYPHNQLIISVILAIVGVILTVTACGSGVRNYSQIPRIHQEVRLEEINKRHFHEAMKYNHKDESNERKSASHVRRFRNGDFSESQDNNTWKQNYSDWMYNLRFITYHHAQLKYYSHPIRNWRDGAGLRSLYP